MIGGCAAKKTLDDYEPVVDLAQSDHVVYERDLFQCREIAKAAQEKFKEEQANQAMERAVVGAIVGVAAGAIVGSAGGNMGAGAAAGGLYGSAAGGASAAADDDAIVRKHPQKIVDRCLHRRGHVVLSDVGDGTGQY